MNLYIYFLELMIASNPLDSAIKRKKYYTKQIIEIYKELNSDKINLYTNKTKKIYI